MRDLWHGRLSDMEDSIGATCINNYLFIQTASYTLQFGCVLVRKVASTLAKLFVSAGNL